MSDPRFTSNSSASPGHPSSGGYSSTPQASPPTSNNSPQKNVIIGAIITVCSSVLIYYLTVHVNKSKTESGGGSYLEKKEATTNAWKRYLVIDNIFYKSLGLIAKDNSLLGKPDKYKAEMGKEYNRFKEDIGLILKEKNIDPSFTLLLKRRIERETESEQTVNQYLDSFKIIAVAPISQAEKNVQLQTTGTNFNRYATRLLKTAGAELEDLSKMLTQTYGQPFDLNELLMYKDYKSALAIVGEDSDNMWNKNPPDSSNFAKNVAASNLIGNWNDNGNSIQLMKDGSMKYSLVRYDDEATGTWTVEKDKLRIDAIDNETKEKGIYFFNLSDITANSFTMILAAQPYDTYHLVRVK